MNIHAIPDDQLIELANNPNSGVSASDTFRELFERGTAMTADFLNAQFPGLGDMSAERKRKLAERR